MEKLPRKEIEKLGKKGRKKGSYEIDGGECIVSGEERFYFGLGDETRFFSVYVVYLSGVK